MRSGRRNGWSPRRCFGATTKSVDLGALRPDINCTLSGLEKSVVSQCIARRSAIVVKPPNGFRTSGEWAFWVTIDGMSQITKIPRSMVRVLGWRGVLWLTAAMVTTIVLLQNSLAVSFRFLFWEMASVSLPAVLAVGLLVGAIAGSIATLSLVRRMGKDTSSQSVVKVDS